MRKLVIVTRVAVRFGDDVPSAEWTEGRFDLLHRIAFPSIQRLPGPVAWALLCAPERYEQVSQFVEALTRTNGPTAVVPVDHMFDRPPPEHVEKLHPGETQFLTARLDSDDAYLPSAFRGVRELEQGTLVDFAAGYNLEWQTQRLERFCERPAKQGPFLAIANDGRENILDAGGLHRDAREGRPVVRVDSPSWIRVVHGGNRSNQMRSRKGRKTWRATVSGRRAAKILRAAGISAPKF